MSRVRYYKISLIPLEPPVTIPSLPSNDRAAVLPVRLVDEAARKLPGRDMAETSSYLVKRTLTELDETTRHAIL